MFESVKRQWREARAARLKEEFADASRRIGALSEEAAEHFGRALDYASNHWLETHGPVKECSEQFRRVVAKELRSQAKQRYARDIGASYALAFFSFHVEASCLPGEDANFVYVLTGQAISSATELIQKLAGKP
ncbi:MAG TPA: hypothetical protein VKS78_01855 [Roseiarcus sp.]|nr:hypothetical protein [Roseiarcus sp.]